MTRCSRLWAQSESRLPLTTLCALAGVAGKEDDRAAERLVDEWIPYLRESEHNPPRYAFFHDSFRRDMG